MRRRWLGGHSRLLFRTFVWLLVGVMSVAVLLEIGLDRLVGSRTSAVDPFVRTTVEQLEARLAALPPEDRPGLLAEAEASLGVPVRLLPPQAVADLTSETDATQALVDSEDRRAYLHRAERIGEMIYIGPMQPAEPSPWVRAAPTLFYSGVFVLVALWLRPILRDIDTISNAAVKFSADYRVPTAAASQTRELTTLAGAVDHMSRRLSSLIQSQKELIAALSHEMRTPLARIRFALAMLDGKDAGDAQPRIAAIKEDLQELDSLIGAMLEYARLDHPELAMHWQRFPASVLADALRQRFADFGKTLVVDSDGADDLTGDVRLLELAASNLVSNAIRHARGEVRCRLERAAGEQILAVEDDGNGVPTADRETVFKAFTRLDDSRSRATGGYGLGLAVVARIAGLHGGEASVETSTALGGAQFVFRWPVARIAAETVAETVAE